MFDSPHFANWLRLHADQPIDFRLVPSSPHRRIHPTLLSIQTGKHLASYSWSVAGSLLALPVWFIDKIVGQSLGGKLLRNEIRTFRPDYVHALEFQHAGYMALKALEQQEIDTTLILTNYGSDIYWFARFPKHLRKIRALLSLAGRYSCECARDVSLAIENGFSGRLLPVQPNSGFFSEQRLEMELLPDDQRDLIMIKGYHGWAGRALVGLVAVKRIAKELSGLRVVVYSCNIVTAIVARIISLRLGLKIETKRKGSVSRDEMLDLFSRTKVYVGLSRTDGISTSLLEAMAVGAIPVQTSTSCCGEWFDKTGVKVDTIAVGAVSEAILNAIKLSKDETNRLRNRETIRARASEEVIRGNAHQFYV